MSNRAQRYVKKYDTFPVVKRYKVLLPAMYPQLEYQLAVLDELEIAVYAKLLELGVPSALWPYYMAFAKRKGKTGLEFWNTTYLAEQAILIDEFMRRGLIEATLEAIAEIVDKWIKEQRGLYEDLLVNSVIFNTWSTVGSSPYLDTDDGDTSKIYTPYISMGLDSVFGLVDTTLDPPYSDITLNWKVKGTSANNDLRVMLYHSIYGYMSVWEGNPNKTDYTLFSKNTLTSGEPLTTYWTTKALINSARARFLKTNSGTDLNITYAYLRVM